MEALSGVRKVKDFSGVSDGGLAYRDYKDAFTNPYLVDENTVQLEKRSNSLNSIKVISCLNPNGAFYVFPSC